MDTSGLAQVRATIEDAAGVAGVPASSIALVVVSKGRSADEVARVVASGHSLFAENRQQGLRERIEGGSRSGIEWHFVGPLQRRKVTYVQAHVSLLHSMDRTSLARSWRGAGDTPVLIQFNLGAEPQKSGFHPESAVRTLDELLGIGVDVRGVMAIPPYSADPEETRPYFTMLRRIFDQYRDQYDNIEHCSMGMTGDFEVAIEEGSTMVRVGRAIFEQTEY